MNQPIQVVTTTDSPDVARRLAQQIVEDGLAACAQVDGPVHSTYQWEGKMEHSDEYRCTFKTDRRLWNQLASRVTELHNYDVPEIIATELVCVSDAYLGWMEKQLKPSESPENPS